MTNSTDLFDSDMIEPALVNYNPRRGMKNKIPWVDKYRPKKLDDIVQQDEVIKVLKESLVSGKFPHMLFFGGPGTGKCVAPDTPVIMFDGSINLAKNIKKNDLLMGDDNTPRKVLGTTSGKDIMYRISQTVNRYEKYGEDYIVNSEHILSFMLSVGVDFSWSKNKYILTWFKNHNIQQKLFIVGDDNYSSKEIAYKAMQDYAALKLTQSRYDIDQTGSICDISVKEYMKKCATWKKYYKGFKSGCITCWPKKDILIDPYTLGFWLSGANTSNDIKNIDMYNLFVEKHVPDNYKIGDLDTRKNVLEGFLAGCANNTFDSRSKRLTDDIVFIARSLGLKVRQLNDDQGITTQVKIGDFDKAGVAKESKFVNSVANMYSVKVTKIDEGEYYGFELDGNGRFLLGDFTVTHNTSSILSFAMELFGPKIFERRVIELNASDERGINVVRNKIITFAKSAVGNADPNYPCPPYKIIILDEADAMTMEAQSALRTVMESLSDITRFCFICNYINQIIDPIASRCMKFRFKSIDNVTMITKLKQIAQKENFVIQDDVLNKVLELAKGDIRCGIITLQYLKYIYDYQGSISVKDIYETTNYLPLEIIKDVWLKCIDQETATVQDVKHEALFLKQKGYSMNSILEKLNQLVIYDETLEDSDKALIALNMAKTEKRLVDGADEYIQLFNSLAYIQKIYKDSRKRE